MILDPPSQAVQIVHVYSIDHPDFMSNKRVSFLSCEEGNAITMTFLIIKSLILCYNMQQILA